MLRNRESDAATGGAKSEPVPLLQSPNRRPWVAPVVSDEIRCEKPQKHKGKQYRNAKSMGV